MNARPRRTAAATNKVVKRSESLPDSDNDSVDPFAFDDKADTYTPTPVRPSRVLGKRKQPSTSPSKPPAHYATPDAEISPEDMVELQGLVKQLEQMKQELAELKREHAVNVTTREREEALAAKEAVEARSVPSPPKKLKADNGTAVAAPSPAPARIRRRSMTPVQRKKLYLAICKLEKAEHLAQMIEIVQRVCPAALVASGEGDDTELDLSIIPSTRLWELQEFVNGVLAAQSSS